jgi:hypothetical protein
MKRLLSESVMDAYIQTLKNFSENSLFIASFEAHCTNFVAYPEHSVSCLTFHAQQPESDSRY